MQKEELAPGIVVYKNVIDGYESLIDDIEDVVSSGAISWTAASVKVGDDSGVYKNDRDTFTIGVSYRDHELEDFSSPTSAFDSYLSSLFLKSFLPLENDYKAEYGVGYSVHDSYAILKYGVGQKFINHIDDHQDFHRRISFVYYMNEDYTGGEINFPRFGISYKPNANELLVFPSTYVYNHSVDPVVSGTRYAVVSWIR